MNKKGIHICSFYYGEKHCLVKATSFLEDGLKKGEKCFYYLEDDLAEKLKDNISKKHLISKDLEFKSIIPLINNLYQKDVNWLKKEFKSLSKKSLEQGYSRTRFLVQSSLIVKEVSKEKLFRWEEVLSDVLVDTPISFLCSYDVTNLIREEKDEDAISKEILDKAFQAHPVLLSAGKLHNFQVEEMAI